LFTRTRRAHYLFAAGLFGILGGVLADRVGRRPVLVIGFAGTGVAFVLLALAGSFATLVPAVLLYGLAVSFVDLGANTVGSAYEQAYAVTAMTGLVLALLGNMLSPSAHSQVSEDGGRPAGGRVWRIPAVLFAIALISVTFFGDGALESFLSTYLQRTLAGGVLLSGFGIGSYHLASLLGRLTATATLRRFGERRVVQAAGLLAAAGLLIAVTAPNALGAIGGLLLVGFAVAPVVPTTLSLAGRSAPGRSGQAVATTTAAGYGAFIVSPLGIGLLAQATSLRVALALLILTSLGIAGLATRWPSPGRLAAAGAQPGERSGERVLGEGTGQVRAEAAGGERAEPDAERGTAERGDGRHRGCGLGSHAVAHSHPGRGHCGQHDARDEAPGPEPARGGRQLVGGKFAGGDQGSHDLARPRAGPGRDDTAVARSRGQGQGGDPGGAARAAGRA
jgi:MFS family permease